MRNKITLKELAKLLNVSVSTVSKALNDSSEISDKTIQRVKELAVLHNYRPNPTAVNLKSSRSGAIAVIVPNIANAFFAKVVVGIEKEAQKKGIQVITYISDESYEREKQIVEMISYGFVDGVIIAPSEETQKKRDFEHIRELLEFDLPIVFYDRINVDFEVDKVGVDDEESTYEATSLFCEKGLKKIAVVSAIEHVDVGRSRIEGYENAMKKFKLPPQVAASETVGELREKIEFLLKNKTQGIVCTDIVSTLLVSRIAHENNIQVPKQLKIIGYQNEDLAPFLFPSLSYIDQHPREIGKTAINFLHSRIMNRAENPAPQKKILKTKLVHLESTLFSDS